MPHICLSCPAASGASLFALSPFALFSLPPASHKTPTPHPPIIPSAERSPPRPPKPHGNVLRNYSEVNRAGCRNEITAAGLSARARGAIRQQEMTRRLHHPLPHHHHRRLAHTGSLPDSSRPPCGKVMQLCSSKGRSPSVSPPPLVSGGRRQETERTRGLHAFHYAEMGYTAGARTSITAWSAARLRATADIKGN